MLVSSVIEWKLPQADGRTVVREHHVDENGNMYDFDYVAEVGTDIEAKLAARAVEINSASSQ